MAGRSRLSMAKSDIVQALDEEGKRIFEHGDLSEILWRNSRHWRLAQSTTVNAFIEYLLKNTEMRKWRAPFKRPVIRYVWKNVTPHELVQSIDAAGYFSHYSAIVLHNLTDQNPKSIYFNVEQIASGGEGELSQRGIDLAFRSKCRVTSNTAEVDDRRIVLLRGRNTGHLGVNVQDTEFGKNLRVTDLERTLIDATVRPIYSGGVFEVARAFKEASSRLSVNRLCAYLRSLKFTYPYHQAVGFYLEHSGVYRSSQIELLRDFPIEFDFYLTHAIGEKRYVKSWRLFVPEGL
jgi:hypothetical protein